MIDIHCHILPYVDDGAFDLDVALELLETEADQGVTQICLTPHLRQEMFETTDNKIRSVFERLQQTVEEEEIPIVLHLSREYYYDANFRKILASGQVIPMGGRVLLVEFSYNSDFAVLEEAAQAVFAAGYEPMFAHVERYRAIQKEPELAFRLMEQGVRLQVNAGSILGTDGRYEKKTARYLLKNLSVFAVASDTHDPRFRAPNLAKCRKFLEKKFSRDYAEELLYTNPLSILSL